jgi:hypothetical protein
LADPRRQLRLQLLLTLLKTVRTARHCPAIDFELADYAAAERLAQKAITEMSKAQLSNSNAGTVRLTLIAAAAHLRDDRAKKTALSDLAISVPELTSLSAIRKWMNPQSNCTVTNPCSRA